MIEQVLNRNNLNRAFVQVFRNKGVGGVDGVQTEDLEAHLRTHGQEYLAAIRERRYQVSPILGKEIPKGNDERTIPQDKCPVDI